MSTRTRLLGLPNILARLAVLSLGATAACGVTPPEQYQIGSARYVVPAADISSVRSKPHLFIRISAFERAYDLIYDARLQSEVDERGHPVIFSITDSPRQQLRYFGLNGDMIVCRAGATPYASCGANLEAAGATWSLLIPPDRLSEADRMMWQARLDLNSYRVR